MGVADFAVSVASPPRDSYSWSLDRCPPSEPMKDWSMLVNSMGKMNLVAGLPPSDFNVSKYWRLIVLASAFWAAELILSRAVLKPSALSIAAC